MRSPVLPAELHDSPLGFSLRLGVSLRQELFPGIESPTNRSR